MFNSSVVSIIVVLLVGAAGAAASFACWCCCFVRVLVLLLRACVLFLLRLLYCLEDKTPIELLFVLLVAAWMHPLNVVFDVAATIANWCRLRPL